MATSTAEPYGRPRDYLWRMAGLGRPVLWSMAAATAETAVAAAIDQRTGRPSPAIRQT